mgnify:CR=1 FL=1
MRLFRIILLLMLVAPFVPDAYAKGYRVTLAREKTDTSCGDGTGATKFI